MAAQKRAAHDDTSALVWVWACTASALAGAAVLALVITLKTVNPKPVENASEPPIKPEGKPALSPKPAIGDPAGDPPSIDSYSFTWRVAESGKIAASIVKNDGVTTVRISNDYSGITITPEDAEKIGEQLKLVDEASKRLTGKASESKNATEKWYVTFSTAPETGFYAAINSRERFPSRGITMTRQEAKSIFPSLLRATKLAAVVDDKIRP